MMDIKSALNWAKNELTKTSEPDSSAMVLMSEITNLTRTEIMAHPEKILKTLELKKFKSLVKRRKAHESVWHIIGKVNFWGLDFFVNKNVLVPRPETEFLVEHVVNYVLAKNYQVNKILDMGTGSGTIAISLGAEFPEINFVAVDKSPQALVMARKNARYNKVKNIKFIKSDLFSNVAGKFDVICANLPYIPSPNIKSLAADVHHYEPRLALDGGERGVEIYERFFKNVGNHLSKKGVIFCEIGLNQGKEIKEIVKKYLPQSKCMISKDLAEIDRIAIIKT